MSCFDKIKQIFFPRKFKRPRRQRVKKLETAQVSNLRQLPTIEPDNDSDKQRIRKNLATVANDQQKKNIQVNLSDLIQKNHIVEQHQQFKKSIRKKRNIHVDEKRKRDEWEGMTRVEVSNTLKMAAAYFWIYEGYSTFFEVTLNDSGKGALRADAFAFNTDKHVIIMEIKSCIQDFRIDQKWHNYFQYCHNFYFCFSSQTYLKLTDEEKHLILGRGGGILVLSNKSGFLEMRHSAKNNRNIMNPNDLLIKLAWKSGISTANSRRYRVFLGKNNETQD